MSSEIELIDGVLDGLDSPTTEEAYTALQDYNDRMVTAAVAQRAVNGGGGGGAAGAVTVLGPFEAAFNTPLIGTDGALLTEVDEGSFILQPIVYIPETWVGSGGLFVFVGDPNGSPLTLWAYDDPAATTSSSLAQSIGGPLPGIVMRVPADGRIYVQCSNTVSAGEIQLYLVVASGAP